MTDEREYKTVKAYYWFSEEAAVAARWDRNIALPRRTPGGKLYNWVALTREESDRYLWPDKVLVETGPFATWLFAGREYEEWTPVAAV